MSSISDVLSNCVSVLKFLLNKRILWVFLFFIVLAYLSRLFPSFSFVVPLLLALFYLFVSFGYTENNIIYSVFRDQGILAIFCSFINLLLPKILPNSCKSTLRVGLFAASAA